MTTPQLLILKNFIEAHPVFSQMPNTTDTDYYIAEQMNKEATPACVVWRTSVPVDEIMRNGMDWVRVDNLSVGKARIWEWMTKLGTINPSKANIRAGIDETWKGSAPDLEVRAAVYTHCKKNCSIFQKLYAVGAGTTNSPSLMEVEGPLNTSDINTARNL